MFQAQSTKLSGSFKVESSIHNEHVFTMNDLNYQAQACHKFDLESSSWSQNEYVVHWMKLPNTITKFDLQKFQLQHK